MTKSIYLAYFTGTGGNSMSLYYLGDGVIAGADIGGMKYDGAYRVDAEGNYEGTVSYRVPPNVLLVTGQNTSAEQKIDLPIKLPANFWNGTVIRIETPLGPVNARFEKLKEIS